MKVTPNPQCQLCKNRQVVFVDGFSGIVGLHNICYTKSEPLVIDGVVFIGDYQDEKIIDGFKDMAGECSFFEKIDLNNLDGVSHMLLEFF